MLNSETPALPHYSASTITMEDFIATVNSQDENIQSLNKRVLYLESTLRETQSQNLIATNTSDFFKLNIKLN